LRKLLPHLDPQSVALAGSVALELALAARGAEHARAPVADIDLVADRLDAVNESVAAEFLVSHYHVAQPGVPKFLIQLADPESGLRVDVFPDTLGAVERACPAKIAGSELRILSLEDIFAHKIQTLSSASADRPIDPKHLRHAHTLGHILGRSVPSVPAESLAAEVFGTDTTATCRRCELSAHPGFPLAPKKDILRVLGYV